MFQDGSNEYVFPWLSQYIYISVRGHLFSIIPRPIFYLVTHFLPVGLVMDTNTCRVLSEEEALRRNFVITKLYPVILKLKKI
jgi:hypothetical protein